MKKLIITCDSKVEQYANYLRQLISANDDKDGEIVGVKDGELEVVVWNDKQYVTYSTRVKELLKNEKYSKYLS